MKKNLTLTASKVTQGLLSYLEKTQRRHLLPQIAKATRNAARGHRGTNHALVETVIPLSPTQINQLETILSAYKQAPVTLTTRINPHLIAGMRLRLGDTLIDQSYAHYLDQLHTNPITKDVNS
jgi:F-type H+-transporting ATPase subunit delta